jgi:hypothetical protein
MGNLHEQEQHPDEAAYEGCPYRRLVLANETTRLVEARKDIAADDLVQTEPTAFLLANTDTYK